MAYVKLMQSIYLDYLNYFFITLFTAKKIMKHDAELACNDHTQGWGHHIINKKRFFLIRIYIYI